MEKNIKILVVSNYTFFSSTRPEASIFIGLKQLGVDATIMTNGSCEHAENFRNAGIKVIDFMPDKKFSNSATQAIKNELLNGSYDALLLFNSKAIINGINAAKHLPVKVILYRGYTGNIHWCDPTAYFKYLHPRVDKIVCNSKAIEELLHRQLFFKKEKAITINKGHDLQWYENVEPLDLSEFGVPKNAFVAACVANARTMKGIKYLLQATYYVPNDLPIYWLLVGRGLDDAQAKKIQANSPNKNKIIFTGFRPDGLRIVKASQTFVLASIKGESITKSVMEAMSLGVAPVITNIPGNRELVIHEESGLVVPTKNAKAIADAVVKLYNNADKRSVYAENARKRIDQYFNTRKTATEYLAMLKELTGK